MTDRPSSERAALGLEGAVMREAGSKRKGAPSLASLQPKREATTSYVSTLSRCTEARVWL